MTEKRTLRRLPQMVLIVCVGACAAILASSLVSSAQAPSVYSNVRRASGQIVAPVYEGWFKSGDEIYALFGYFNPNTQEIVNVPVGPNNKVESGALDHGQPTRFYPGRHHGVVAMAVPDAAAMTELNWVLTVQNETLSIPSNLIQEYVIAPLEEPAGRYPGNTPPVLMFDQTGPSAQGPAGLTTTRTTAVSRALPLEVWVTDDGLPPPPDSPGARGGPDGVAGRGGRGGDRSEPTPDSQTAWPRPPRGLAVTWSVYRGPGSATFGDSTPPVEQGKASTTATFSEPGDYTLHVVATDGSRSLLKCCWTNGYVKVTVDAGGNDR